MPVHTLVTLHLCALGAQIMADIATVLGELTASMKALRSDLDALRAQVQGPVPPEPRRVPPPPASLLRDVGGGSGDENGRPGSRSPSGGRLHGGGGPGPSSPRMGHSAGPFWADDGWNADGPNDDDALWGRVSPTAEAGAALPAADEGVEGDGQEDGDGLWGGILPSEDAGSGWDDYVMRLTQGRGRGTPPPSRMATPLPQGKEAFAGNLAGYCSDEDDPWWGPHWNSAGQPHSRPETQGANVAHWPLWQRDEEQYRRRRARYVGGRWVTYGPRREVYIRAIETEDRPSKWVLVWGPLPPHDNNCRGPTEGEKRVTRKGFHG